MLTDLLLWVVSGIVIRCTPQSYRTLDPPSFSAHMHEIGRLQLLCFQLERKKKTWQNLFLWAFKPVCYVRSTPALALGTFRESWLTPLAPTHTILTPRLLSSGLLPEVRTSLPTNLDAKHLALENKKHRVQATSSREAVSSNFENICEIHVL